MSQLFEVATHLEFLGYELIFNDDNDTVYANHSQRFNLLISQGVGGVMISSMFDANFQGQRLRLPLLEGINSFNTKAVFCRCYVNPNLVIVFEAIYQQEYNRSDFGVFLEVLNHEFQYVFDDDVNLIRFVK